MSEVQEKAKRFCSNVIQQFISRTEIEGKKRGIVYNVKLDVALKGNTLFFTFTQDEEVHAFTIPMPFEEDGVLLIEQNEVRRAVCNFFQRDQDLIIDYFGVMHRVLLGSTQGLVSSNLSKKTPFLQQIIFSFENRNTAAIIHNLQRTINEIVNKFPLHETAPKSWCMNRRLVFIDPVFDSLLSPEKRLQYHIDKNKQYFERGWTSIGLSDGSLADKNYMLTEDLRKYTPFGEKYHNPQRNLFSTLGMRGDELPNIRTESMQKLIDQGVTRKGWNLFTAFVDVPDVFEDQILVDISHSKKFITLTKRYQCFGQMRVRVGEVVKKGQTLSISDAGIPKTCDIDAEKIWVASITETTVNVGGVPTPGFHVVLSYKRYLKDGVKFSNLHGNKGVIRMRKLGHAIDPRTGELRKIDVIVSAKSVRKRKNFGQLFEALANNLWEEEEKPIIFTDDATVNLDSLKNKLKAKGLPEDGTWMCNTYAGQLPAVCGTVFWGVTASVENALWDEGDTVRVNNRLLRTAGLKFSHVELRALQTRFGKDNPILDEIMQYAQGAEDLHESIAILKSKRGELPAGKPVVNFKDVKSIDQSHGTLFPEEAIRGSIVDEYLHPDGFILELPITYFVMVDKNEKVLYEGAGGQHLVEGTHKVYSFNKIYVPSAPLRRCWQHDTGKYGLSEIGVLLNNLLTMCSRHAADPSNAFALLQVYRFVQTYFDRVAAAMGTKRGTLSTLGMSVRYPFSAKAVATLSNRLPADTVEIHENMAKILGVKNGDVVLVERFPCLGFMSIRPQRVQITKDEMCRYTIRVSGNCLCSLGLDFDGDVIYLASFHTPEAKALLCRELENPQPECHEVICRLNEKAGKPQIDCLCLDDYNIIEFPRLTCEAHAEIVEKATGVKSHTGPVIALAYNLMRIVESSPKHANDQKLNIAVEVFLDRVGNTVFKQKHGVKSLHCIVTEAICTADVETLVSHGFNRETSETLCNLIRERAAQLGVQDLNAYHVKAKENGWSNIINRIVREQNRIYFASRANLEGLALLKALEAPAVDVPSEMVRRVLACQTPPRRTPMDEHMDEKMIAKLSDAASQLAARKLIGVLRDACENKNTCSAEKKENCLMITKHIRKFHVF